MMANKFEQCASIQFCKELDKSNMLTLEILLWVSGKTFFRMCVLSIVIEGQLSVGLRGIFMIKDYQERTRKYGDPMNSSLNNLLY